jgi:hypothetical protein
MPIVNCAMAEIVKKTMARTKPGSPKANIHRGNPILPQLENIKGDKKVLLSNPKALSASPAMRPHVATTATDTKAIDPNTFGFRSVLVKE